MAVRFSTLAVPFFNYVCCYFLLLLLLLVSNNILEMRKASAEASAAEEEEKEEGEDSSGYTYTQTHRSVSGIYFLLVTYYRTNVAPPPLVQ